MVWQGNVIKAFVSWENILKHFCLEPKKNVDQSSVSAFVADLEMQFKLKYGIIKYDAPFANGPIALAVEESRMKQDTMFY